jgi:hypothetical protein
MLKFILTLTAAAALSFVAPLCSAQPQDARQQQMEHKFELAKKYYGECKHTDSEEFEAIRPYLKAFTDVEVMADMMADPAKAMKLMQIVGDPRTVHVMTKCATEPVMWDTWMRGLTDYNKMFRAMMRFTNPMIYFNWMMAPMNPQTYTAMMGMMSPENLNRWFIASMNPAFYQPFFQPMVDPGWYTPRFNWMMDPRSYQPMMNMFMVPGMPQAIPAPQAAAPAAPPPAAEKESEKK